METFYAVLIIAILLLALYLHRFGKTFLANVLLLGVGMLILYNDGTYDFMIQGIGFLFFSGAIINMILDIFKPALREAKGKPMFRYRNN